jgi:F-type H+-transporting ATPase subunit b
MSVPITVFLSGGKPVDLDATLFIQLGIFLIMFLFLRSLLFRPVIRLIEMRRKVTEGNKSKAEAFEREAAELNETVTAKLAEVRGSVSKERDKILEQARQQSREVLTKARDEARAVVDQAKEETVAKAEQVRSQLQAEITPLVDAVAAKVIGRPI